MSIEEKPATLMDWELQQHREDCLMAAQIAIAELMALYKKGSELKIICGEYEAVIKRSEQC